MSVGNPTFPTPGQGQGNSAEREGDAKRQRVESEVAYINENIKNLRSLTQVLSGAVDNAATKPVYGINDYAATKPGYVINENVPKAEIEKRISSQPRDLLERLESTLKIMERIEQNPNVLQDDQRFAQGVSSQLMVTSEFLAELTTVQDTASGKTLILGLEDLTDKFYERIVESVSNI